MSFHAWRIERREVALAADLDGHDERLLELGVRAVGGRAQRERSECARVGRRPAGLRNGADDQCAGVSGHDNVAPVDRCTAEKVVAELGREGVPQPRTCEFVRAGPRERSAPRGT